MKLRATSNLLPPQKMQVSVGGGQYPLCRAKIPNPQGCSSSLFFYSKSCTHCYLLPSLVSKNIPIGKLQYCSGYETGPRNQRNVGAIYASEAGAETSTTAAETDDAERWVLEPVGDGDSRHIGFKVSMPGAFEIASSAVTVGRLPEKADIVIPVGTVFLVIHSTNHSDFLLNAKTVSGVHARIEKKDGVLLVTDLDSTNGTFIGEKRLKPGVAAPLSSGSYITFGDTNLAIFRVSKLENAEVPGKSEESEAKTEDSSVATG
ncbi:hypothetical protein RHGRI_002098 [Rhododendron griersonianum]|uniref:FHA domain-containing protein n=1 Tax=Rhododendron griersonianum TaxID=479676 RepID=A0AAV6LNV6_9ERIC|nr:hypothetical protein RHGRI_002098 [Rhododendron griersonianum]